MVYLYFCRDVRAPGLSLNISCNHSIEPIHLAPFLGRYGNNCMRFVDFRAQSCPRLAEALEGANNAGFNILGRMANLGVSQRSSVL